MMPETSPTPDTKQETGTHLENPEGCPEKTPKNAQFDKWAQELTQFIEEIEQKCASFYTETQPIHDKKETPRKHKEKTKWYRFNTQTIRRTITRELGKFYEAAIESALNTELPLDERERWGRLSSYTAQTINSIISAYDNVRIEETLDELKQFVKNQKY